MCDPEAAMGAIMLGQHRGLRSRERLSALHVKLKIGTEKAQDPQNAGFRTFDEVTLSGLACPRSLSCFVRTSEDRETTAYKSSLPRPVLVETGSKGRLP